MMMDVLGSCDLLPSAPLSAVKWLIVARYPSPDTFIIGLCVLVPLS